MRIAVTDLPKEVYLIIKNKLEDRGLNPNSANVTLSHIHKHINIWAAGLRTQNEESFFVAKIISNAPYSIKADVPIAGGYYKIINGKDNHDYQYFRMINVYSSNAAFGLVSGFEIVIS